MRTSRRREHASESHFIHLFVSCFNVIPCPRTAFSWPCVWFREVPLRLTAGGRAILLPEGDQSASPQRSPTFFGEQSSARVGVSVHVCYCQRFHVRDSKYGSPKDRLRHGKARPRADYPHTCRSKQQSNRRMPWNQHHVPACQVLLPSIH